VRDLRHRCATSMASCGVPTDVRQRVMNQISGQSIGGRYEPHDYMDEKRRALEIWEKRLLEIVHGRPPSGLRW
jgi:integrase